MIKNLPITEITDLLKEAEDCFSDGFNVNNLENSIADGRFCFFSEVENGEPIGFVGVTFGLDFADIDYIYVKKAKRRNGFAKSLLSFTENAVKEKGLNKIFLEVRYSNNAAINLYRSFGFKEISERKKYYSDGETAIVFLKEI